jgi:hypothetical protein
MKKTTEGKTIVLPALPEEQPLQEQVALTIVDQARALQISTIPMLEVARDFVRQLNERIKFVQEHHKPIKDAAFAAHKIAVAQEKKVLDPLGEAKTIVTDTANVFLLAEKRREEEERRLAAEEARKEQAKRIAAAERKVGAILAKAGDDSAHLAELRDQLEAPETSDEEASLMRSQISILEAKIAGHQKRAEDLRREAERRAAAPPPPVAAPAAPPAAKTKGVVGRRTVTVEVVDIKALCRGVADGIIPPGAVEGVAKILKGLAEAGMNLEQFGCRVDDTTTSHFR